MPKNLLAKFKWNWSRIKVKYVVVCLKFEILYEPIIAEPEGEATNLDAQVAERLYVYMYICVYVYMSITVSCGHLARGLKIVSVAIPMASSCSIHLYNVLNSRFRLLPILCCSCGSQFGERLRQSVRHFLLPVAVKVPPVHGDAGQNGVSSPKRVPGVRGSKALGSEIPFDRPFQLRE